MRSVRIHIGDGFLPDVVASAWCLGEGDSGSVNEEENRATAVG
jgi:hypothetical protein